MLNDDALADDDTIPLTRVDQMRQDEFRQKRNLKVVYFVNFCSNICFSLITPLIWSYLADFQISQLGYALIVSAFPAGSAFGSLFWSWRSNYAYRHPLVLSLALTLFFTLTYSFFPIPSIIGVSRFFQGFGSANNVLLINFIINRSSIENRTRSLTIFSIFGTFGLVIGPILGGLLAKRNNFWIGTFLFRIEPLAGLLQSLILIATLVLVLLFFVDRESAVNQIYFAEETPSQKRGYSRFWITLRLILIGISFLSCYFLFSAFETFLTPFFEVYYGYSRSSVSFLWAASGALVLITYAAVIVLSRKLDIDLLTTIYLLIIVLGSILLNWERPFASFFIGLILLNIGLSGSILTLTSSLSLEINPRDTPLFIGLFTTFGYVVRSLTPIGLTWVFEKRDSHYVLVLLQIVTSFGFLVNSLRIVSSWIFLLTDKWNWKTLSSS